MKSIAQNPSLEKALGVLAELSPNAPFLALGQTVFWDEPMKAGVALAASQPHSKRRFIAAVHDTDYFAKAPGARSRPGHFSALAHNDTDTKGLWSAAGEFSTLFGSETVITKEDLLRAGLRVHALLRCDPHCLDSATEAWGWRGIASLEEHPPISADMDLESVWPHLQATFKWAIDQTLECTGGEDRGHAMILADKLLAGLCRYIDTSASLADFYRQLLPFFYSLTAGHEMSVEASQTSELLRYNTSTCSLPRFDLLDLFINPDTRPAALAAYNQAIAGSGLYDTHRFGIGAIPFDLVVPGHGRGTLRIGSHGIVVQCPTPLFLTIPKGLTLRGRSDLASLIEAKFGSSCAVVGKAVTLIGMFAKEFVFVFHEGASGYVKYSRRFHRALAEAFGFGGLNPILRIRYDAWGSLDALDAKLRLPKPFQGPFGTEDISAKVFASCWAEVGREQQDFLTRLSTLRRPQEWLACLADSKGGEWVEALQTYEDLNQQLAGLRQEIEEMRAARRAVIEELAGLKRRRQTLEQAKGEHFRAKIFEKEPTGEDIQERSRISGEIAALGKEIGHLEGKLRASARCQREIVGAPDMRARHRQRQRIMMAAERARLAVIRDAIIASKGLAKANLRPSAWWLHLLSSDGAWFRRIWETAECYLEPTS